MDTDTDIDDDLLESPEGEFVERFRRLQNDEDRRREEILGRVYDSYLHTPYDAEMAKHLAALVENSLRTHGRRPIEGRALVVIGESGAGKTWTVRHAIDGWAEYETGGDDLPFVSMVAPSPCTLKQLGREVLRKLGYPLERDLREHMTWEKVRERLKARHVRVLWIDEMHHAMRDADAQKLRDTLKNVMQQEDWPVSFILSGLPLLADFIAGDYQLQRCKWTIQLQDLQYPERCQSIRRIVRKIVEEHAGMVLAADLESDEFVHRLQHAACGRFGMIVTFVRAAVEQALTEDASSNSVRLAHFAAACKALTGCNPAQNIFIAEQWHEIDSARLFFPEDEEEMPEQPKPSRARHRSKCL